MITVRDAFARILAMIHDMGGPLFEKGDRYADMRSMPDFTQARTIMLDDGRDGWYISIKLQDQNLPKGDSMALLATKVSGWIKFDVALDADPGEGSPNLSDGEILDLPLRPETETSKSSIVRFGMMFTPKNCGHRTPELPTMFFQVNLDTNQIETW